MFIIYIVSNSCVLLRPNLIISSNKKEENSVKILFQKDIFMSELKGLRADEVT